MKLYGGDIPKEDLVVLEGLIESEKWFNDHGSTINPAVGAKAFVCLAHDYYDIEMEEEGDRLLLRAEKLYPGYFMAAIRIHAELDPEFSCLVRQIKETLALPLMRSLGFSDEPV